MKTLNYRHIAIIALLFMALTALAQDNDKILNRQYADMKKVHYGFSVGANFQDLKISHIGFISEDGQ